MIDQILERLQGIEGVPPDIVQGIKKAYEQANAEAERWKQRADKAQESVNRLNELIGGEGKDATKALSELSAQLESAKKERDKYKGETEKLKAESTRRTKIDGIVAIASKNKLDPQGLKEMIECGAIDLEAIQINEGAIAIGGKTIDEVFNDKPFLKKALQSDAQPTQATQAPSTQPTQPQQVPNGGTNGKSQAGNATLKAIGERFKIPAT